MGITSSDAGVKNRYSAGTNGAHRLAGNVMGCVYKTQREENLSGVMSQKGTVAIVRECRYVRQKANVASS
jgi:hypothetical protein